jgi:hypothetical protein
LLTGLENLNNSSQDRNIREAMAMGWQAEGVARNNSRKEREATYVF